MEGLLLGLGAGLKSGVDSYQKARDQRNKIEQDAMDRELKRQIIEIDAKNKGLLINSKGEPEVDLNSPINLLKQQELDLKKEIESTRDEKQKGLLDQKLKQMQLDAKSKGMLFADNGEIQYDMQSPYWRQKQEKLDIERIKAQRPKTTKESVKAKEVTKKEDIGGSKPTSAMVENLAASKTALDSLRDAQALADSNPDMFGKAQSLVGSAASYLGIGETGTKAASIDADLMSKAQTIGRYLEGGKLAEGDAIRYAKMLPQRGDNPTIVQNKIKTLERMISQKYANDKAGYEAAGYGVKKFEDVPVAKGLINQDLTTKDVKASSEKIKVSDGKRTFLISPSKLQDAIKDGFQEVK